MKEAKVEEILILLGNQIKTIVLWRHIIAKYIEGNTHNEVLKEKSPKFTWAFRQLIISDLFMKLGVLLDPAGSGSQKNISILAAKKALEADGYKIPKEVKEKMKDYASNSKKIKQWRNKAGAHLDQNYNIMGQGKATITWGEVKKIIELAIDICKSFSLIANIDFDPLAHIYYDDLDQRIIG